MRHGSRIRRKPVGLVQRGGHTDVACTIDADLIREFVQMVSQSDLAELQIERNDLRIRLTRRPSPVQPAVQLLEQAPPQLQPRLQTPETPQATPPAEIGSDHPGLIKSPMVGTLYHRARAEAEPFAAIGAQVKAGDTVFLVEAMKTFNEITAHRSGIVTAIMVDDNQPVEYGEPLMLVE